MNRWNRYLSTVSPILAPAACSSPRASIADLWPSPLSLHSSRLTPYGTCWRSLLTLVASYSIHIPSRPSLHCAYIVDTITRSFRWTVAVLLSTPFCNARFLPLEGLKVCTQSDSWSRTLFENVNRMHKIRFFQSARSLAYLLSRLLRKLAELKYGWASSVLQPRRGKNAKATCGLLLNLSQH